MKKHNIIICIVNMLHITLQVTIAIILQIHLRYKLHFRYVKYQSTFYIVNKLHIITNYIVLKQHIINIYSVIMLKVINSNSAVMLEIGTDYIFKDRGDCVFEDCKPFLNIIY